MKSRIPLLSILFLALILRLPYLGSSFWLDEAAQAMESVRPLSAQLSISQDFQPPLFHLIVHFFSLVSHTEWWMRMPSLVAGIGTVAILYMILKQQFGKRAAVIGSLLLATSPFHIFYSQELRPYALATFWAVLSWLFLLQATSDKRQEARKNFILYTVVSVLGLYTMYLYPFNILAQLLYIFFEKKSFGKTLCVSLITISLAFLPWLPSFWEQLHVGTGLTTKLPGWAQAVGTPQLKALPLTLAKFFVGQVEFKGNVVFILISCVVIGLALLATIPLLNEKKTRPFWYWVCVPILGSWFVSFFIPVIQPKRLLFALPGVFALLVIHHGKWSRIILGAMIGLQLFSLVWYLREPQFQRENWRDLIATIEREGPSHSVVLFSFPEDFAPWQWYGPHRVQSLSTGTLLAEDSHTVDSAISQLPNDTTVYLFDYLRDLTDPTHRLDSSLASHGFSQVSLMDGRTIGFVRVFVRGSGIE